MSFNGNKCLHVRYIPLLYIYFTDLFRSFALVVALVRVYTRNQSDFRFLLQLLAYVHIRSFSFYGAGQLLNKQRST